MKPTLTHLTTMLLMLAVPATDVWAQEIPCSSGPCVRRSRPGTHFIAELNGGGTFAPGFGPALGGVVGVGGKLRGFPPRFYLVAELSYASTSLRDQLAAGTSLSEERTYRDLALGLRTYVPIFGPVRIFVDLLGGATHMSATMLRAEQIELDARQWAPLFTVGGGVQLRLLHHLSVGLRAKVALGQQELGKLRQLVGAEDGPRTTTTAGLTWHF